MKRYFGKYSGTVFDNNDPKGIGRVKAFCPAVGFVEFPTNWARPCYPFPGLWSPNTGEKIWLEFEAGDPNTPIWTGIFYGAPGGTSEAPQGQQLKTDFILKILGQLLAEATGNWEVKALQFIIDSASIKLGKTAVEGLIKSSFGNIKYNAHQHTVTAVGSPTGPPLPPNNFLPATDATQKVKGE